LELNNNIVPDKDDTSTLFVCSGMQNLKHEFKNCDGSQKSTFQKCIRTNDIDLIGDGTHLTNFTMIGTFGFGSNNYEEHCKLWLDIVRRLNIKIDYVTYHPKSKHKNIWNKLGCSTIPDDECKWSQGPGFEESFCCEFYSGGLEIGNLVNPNDVSIDVGFGLERLLMLFEGKARVDETSLFDSKLSYIGRDYKRTLELMFLNDIKPGNKGRNYICRRLLRKFIRIETTNDVMFKPYIDVELEQLERVKENYRKYKHKFRNRDSKFWWETFGVLPEELEEF
jgi:alanyl-tRNA synthetase